MNESRLPSGPPKKSHTGISETSKGSVKQTETVGKNATEKWGSTMTVAEDAPDEHRSLGKISKSEMGKSNKA